MDWLKYANQGAVRNLPLSERMIKSLSFLPAMGIQMEVFSGGQPEKGSGKPRVGSVRHDHGDAADVFFYKDGRKLDWANEADRPIFEQIVSQASANGLTGFGAGDGYMQRGSMHIGYGNKAVWGAGGKGVNAPDWLRRAAGGSVPQTQMAGGKGTDFVMGQQGADTMQKQQPTGLMGKVLGPKAQAYLTPERIARAQMALEGATLNPNQGVIQAAQTTLKTAQEGKARNKTVDWLRGQGREDLAAAVESGSIDGKTAANVVFAKAKDERTAMAKNFEFLMQQGYSREEALQAIKSGTSVNVNTGSTGIDYGKPEAGRVWSRNPDGSVKLDERGAPIAVAYQGGSAYEKQQQSAAEAKGAQIAAEARGALEARSGGVVIEDIARIKEKVKSAKWYEPAVGLGADLLAGVGGTKAADVAALTKTVRANIGFDRLQQMREASPTGGALGSVSEQELATLQAVMGNLEQSQSQEQFMQNLDRVGEIYTNIMAKFAKYPNAADFGFGSASGKTSGATHRYNAVTGKVEPIK